MINNCAVIIDPMPISDEDFGFFKTEILRLTGISLSEAKRELVKSRLRSRVVAMGLKGFEEYRIHLKSLSPSDTEWQEFVNSLTTNKTDWFREKEHFEILQNRFLPGWIKLGKRKLNVWCAASSTGEEPYSLALLLDTYFKGTPVDYEILATDIDTEVLNTAARGVYPKSGLMLVPEKYHKVGFDFGTKEISSWVRVKGRIKEKVHFEQFNLAQNIYPWKSRFDLIFCRNVLIYFNSETTRSVVENAHHAASKEAALFIAHSESLQNIKTSWKYLEPSIYKKGERASW